MEHEGKLTTPITLTLESQGVVDLLAALLRAVGVTTFVAFHVDTNEVYDILHKLETSCSSGLPELKVTKKR
jgi:hypothetical protein